MTGQLKLFARRFFAALLASVLLISMCPIPSSAEEAVLSDPASIAGNPNTQDPSISTADSVESDQPILSIGKAEESFASISFINETGFSITSIEVKETDTDQYQELKYNQEGDWQNAKEATIHLSKPEDETKTVQTASFDIKLVSLEKTYVLHAFNADKIESAKILFDTENDLCYLETTFEDNSVHNTLETERAIALEPEESTSEEQDAVTNKEDKKQLISVEEAEALTGISAADEGIGYVAGEVLVVYEPGESQAKASESLETAESVADNSVEQAESVTAEVEGGRVVSDTAIDPIVVVKLEEGVSVVQAVAELSQDPTVKLVEPNYLYALEEDSSEFDLFGIDSVEADLSATLPVNDPQNNQASYQAINLFDAWALQKCEGKVLVATLDTGCYVDHPDIKENVVGAYNAYDESSDVTDDNGHGTKVAGVMCARANNGLDSAGVSYNAGLVVVKVADEKGSSSVVTQTKGVEWILQNKDAFGAPIRVINKSLGSAQGSTLDQYSQILNNTVSAAKDAGILTVASAGNATATATPPYPHRNDYDCFLSVMNLDSSTGYDSLYSSSNYNEADVNASTPNRTKDICAPGTGVITLTNSGGYSTVQGTSFSAPFVSGVAALCFAADPNLTPDDVVEILESTATDLGDDGWDQKTGWGRVDAKAALEATIQIAPEKDLADAQVSIEYESCVYSGEEMAPQVTILWEDTTLVPDVDFTLSYENNVNVGTATVTVQGLGDYSGSVSKTFTIAPADISSAQLRLSYWSRMYNGSPMEPTPTVKLGSKTLVLGTDYSVTYENNIESGTATVIIAGCGNYSGTIEDTFTIWDPPAKVRYQTYFQDYGWLSWAGNGALSGKLNRGKGIEGICIKLENVDKASIMYRTYMQDSGWQSWRWNGATAGATGDGSRVEAIQIRLANRIVDKYDVYYRVYIEGSWSEWAKNGGVVGIPGDDTVCIEAISVRLVKKGNTP